MNSYEPLGGTTINQACAEALAIANMSGHDVTFKFNDTELVAKPGGNSAAMVDEWKSARQIARAKWEASPEGIKYKCEASERSAKAINETNDLLYTLSGVLRNGNLDELMTWLAKFAPASDHIDASKIYDKNALAKILEDAGYVSGEFVGQKEQLNNRANFGRYIVGQAISCLRAGVPPHPVTVDFVKRYFAIPE